MSPPLSAPAYRERLTPSWWIYLAAIGLAGGLGISLSKLGDTAALLTFGLGSVILVLLLLRWTPVVAVTTGSLQAGRARIPLTMLGAVEVLDPDAMRRATGPGLDARAYLCLRGWVATGVRVHLVDPKDPTPYWLVSSRRPVLLAAAITAEQPSS